MSSTHQSQCKDGNHEHNCRACAQCRLRHKNREAHIHNSQSLNQATSAEPAASQPSGLSSEQMN